MDIDKTNTAIFYDIENLIDLSKVVKRVEKEITNKNVLIKRGFTNWATLRTNDKIMLLNNGISPVQVITQSEVNGTINNASDIAMAVDIIDVLHTKPNINHYYIISGDGGFVNVVLKLKEYGKKVTIVSIDKCLSNLLRSFCNDVISINTIEKVVQTNNNQSNQEIQEAQKLQSIQKNKVTVVKKSKNNQEIDLFENYFINKILNNSQLNIQKKLQLFFTKNQLVKIHLNKNGICVDSIVEKIKKSHKTNTETIFSHIEQVIKEYVQNLLIVKYKDKIVFMYANRTKELSLNKRYIIDSKKTLQNKKEAYKNKKIQTMYPDINEKAFKENIPKVNYKSDIFESKHIHPEVLYIEIAFEIIFNNLLYSRENIELQIFETLGQENLILINSKNKKSVTIEDILSSITGILYILEKKNIIDNELNIIDSSVLSEPYIENLLRVAVYKNNRE